MHDRDEQAIALFLEANPRLREAHAVWAGGAGLLTWAQAIFPNLGNTDQVEDYILFNALMCEHSGREKHMRFALGKIKPDTLAPGDMKALDVITFFERFTLEELQRLGI